MNDGLAAWGIALRVYWLITWRTAAMYFIAYAPFNLLYMWLIVTKRWDDSIDVFVPRLALSTLLLAGAGFIAVRMALRKRYRGFRIKITRDEPAS
jgi:hypothetical protein